MQKPKRSIGRCSFRSIDHRGPRLRVYYIHIYKNAQIGFTSRGLIDVYAAIAPMVERNPIRRAIRESKRDPWMRASSNPFDSHLLFFRAPRCDDCFFFFSFLTDRGITTTRLLSETFGSGRNPWDDFNSLVLIRLNVPNLWRETDTNSATLRRGI